MCVSVNVCARALVDVPGNCPWALTPSTVLSEGGALTRRAGEQVGLRALPRGQNINRQKKHTHTLNFD